MKISSRSDEEDLDNFSRICVLCDWFDGLSKVIFLAIMSLIRVLLICVLRNMISVSLLVIVYFNVDLQKTVDYLLEVTKSVIEDFEQDNVKYLELRSTPRINPATGIEIFIVDLIVFIQVIK